MFNHKNIHINSYLYHQYTTYIIKCLMTRFSKVVAEIVHL